MLYRTEPEDIKVLGYKWNMPHDIVDLFEKKVASYVNCKYAIATDSASSAIFLTLKYINTPTKITIPKNTYISVPNYIKLAGYDVIFDDREWSGSYQLNPIDVWDSSGRFTSNMFNGSHFEILSFQFKKILPIGKGGMILTNDKHAYSVLKKMRYDGRDINKSQYDDNIEMIGYHMYMTPEDAARGLLLMESVGIVNEDSHNNMSYKPLTDYTIFEKTMRL
jgi:dTDP-4-amino-4,6-dideoxygalactose transaminase